MTCENEHLTRDAGFLAIALALHGAVLVVDPGIRWGQAAAPERIVPIEFVALSPNPALAPIPPGTGAADAIPDNGPGPAIPARIEAPKDQKPAPKPRAAKKAKSLKRASAASPKPKASRARPASRPAVLARKPGPTPAQLARANARRRMAELSRELASLRGPDEPLASPAAPEASAAGRSAASIADDPASSSGGEFRDAVSSERPGPERPMGGGIKRTDGAISWSIDGPIGTRRLLRRQLPVSPDWVAQRGLDLTVQIKFQVLEDGTVKHGALIKVTSGFPDLDRLALDALRRWRFEAVPKQSASAPTTWGVVTLRFTMG